MLVVVAGAASRNDGGARARGARSLGARRRGVSEGGSGLLGWAAALVVGLLVVSVAVVLGGLALTLVGVPVSAAAPVTLFQSAGPLEQLAGAACLSEDGGGGSAGSAGGCVQRWQGCAWGGSWCGALAIRAPEGCQRVGRSAGTGDVAAGGAAGVIASGAGEGLRFAARWPAAADAGWASSDARLVAVHCVGAAAARGRGPTARAAAAAACDFVRCAAA